MLALQANAKRNDEEPSAYVAIPDTPKGSSNPPVDDSALDPSSHVVAPDAPVDGIALGRQPTGISHRRAHQRHTRRHLSKLERSIHEDHSTALKPTGSLMAGCSHSSTTAPSTATAPSRRLHRGIASCSHDEERQDSRGDNSWKALFSAKYRKQLVIAIALCSAQQLTGIDAIMYYSSGIFAKAGLTDPRVGNTIINLIRTTFILVAARVMDKFLRKTLLCGGMAIMGVASAGVMVSLVYTSSVGCVASLAVYMAAFCLSIGPMAWMVSTEIFPDFLHANAGSTGELFTWLCNFVVGVSYPFVADPSALGNYAFGIFVGLCGAFVAFVAIVVPETARKTIVEIQMQFGITAS
ncbi:hypothetical protein AeMF1_011446 [Aphanomyces euteiches]|nr:hypothetical protein AeMF1_011446 [Aphanomyces euteiches]